MFHRLVVVLLGLLVACAKPPRPTGMGAAVEVVQTPDGWRLPVRRHGGEGPPVVLVHGLSASGWTWDGLPHRSLVPGLVADGWDVWVLSLRGDDGTEAPSRAMRWRHGFDDHLQRDLPALLDHISERTGYAKVAWVGHSMGGMLLYGTLRDRPERIGAAVTLSSPARFALRVGRHEQAARGRWRGDGRVPVQAVGRGAIRLGMWREIDRRVGAPGWLGESASEVVGWWVANDSSRRMLRLAAEWLRRGEVVDEQGQPVLADADVPVLVMGGPADDTVSWRDIAHACEVLSDCTFVPLSRERGLSHDHGHTDPVLGRTAPLEVFPDVRAFLRRHRAAVAASSE